MKREHAAAERRHTESHIELVGVCLKQRVGDTGSEARETSGDVGSVARGGLNAQDTRVVVSIRGAGEVNTLSRLAQRRDSREVATSEGLALEVNDLLVLEIMLSSVRLGLQTTSQPESQDSSSSSSNNAPEFNHISQRGQPQQVFVA